jgi:hypothetical protein
MNRIAITWLVCFLFSLSAYAQLPEVITTEGESQVEFPESSSLVQVKKAAFDKAVVNALEKAFGTAVIQGNSTYLKNVQSGKQTQTSTVFNLIANTYVKGEVIKVLDESYKEAEGFAMIDGKKRVVREIHCTVRLKVRELTETAPDFDAFTLDCTDPHCSTAEFNHDDQLYLYFRSKSGGYLLVFLDDGKVAQCLLPYRNMPDRFACGVPVNRETEYILFSRDPKLTYFESQTYTDEYQASAESTLDQNRMFIIFSSTPVDIPDLKEGLNSEILSAFETSKGYQVPRATGSEEFQDWLIKSRLRKHDIRVKIIDITITR